MSRVAGRVAAYITLAIIAFIALAPFAYLLILSFKKRIEIASDIPPTLSFEWATIVRNYSEVVGSQGMLGFVFNSVVVVGFATLIGLILGTPAAYAFSRLDFRGREKLASTILSFRFMPPIAVAIWSPNARASPVRVRENRGAPQPSTPTTSTGSPASRPTVARSATWRGCTASQ